jgi:SAM-dependent methyltransferase
VSWDTVTPYHRGFREFAEAYDAFGFADIHAHALPHLPAKPGLMLDVGAGSGRDAEWFATQGWEVVAAEPATALRQEATSRHPSPRIRWIDDRLPALANTHRLGLGFDLVWLSGVWMHLPPQDRPRAMRKLATLLKPGGRMVITLRHGPAPEDRPMWPVDQHEVERLGVDLGLALRVATGRTPDIGGRPGITWQTVILDLPDDGAGALPTLRGVILRQEKSSTYKLGLLRSIARIADAYPNLGRDAGDDIELPLGLVALTWLRMYKPLVERGLPQLTGTGMGFVKAPFLALAALAAHDLRPGAVFHGEEARHLRLALRDAARLIADMPARHLTYGNDLPVFPSEPSGPPPAATTLAITPETLWAYGTTRVPIAIWRAFCRMSAWIEPMLLAEWVRLTQGYAERAGRVVTTDEAQRALRWLEPERDTAFVRSLALNRLHAGRPVSCVWSGRPLGASLDIDHCLPWSAWPCGDLWNLLPATSAINQRQKRDRLVTADALAAARPRILAWWQETYLANPALAQRFTEEARSSLPLPHDRTPDPEEVFAALDFRRLRLRQDTQAQEWAGPG